MIVGPITSSHTPIIPTNMIPPGSDSYRLCTTNGVPTVTIPSIKRNIPKQVAPDGFTL